MSSRLWLECNQHVWQLIQHTRNVSTVAHLAEGCGVARITAPVGNPLVVPAWLWKRMRERESSPLRLQQLQSALSTVPTDKAFSMWEPNQRLCIVPKMVATPGGNSSICASFLPPPLGAFLLAHILTMCAGLLSIHSCLVVFSWLLRQERLCKVRMEENSGKTASWMGHLTPTPSLCILWHHTV